MSKEWAIFDQSGEIVNMAMTQGDPPKLWAGYTTKPIEEVPKSVLERYRYWFIRP
jgi:hypothetical protein